MFIQLFYTLYLIYMEKKVKQMFMEMICLYNCFTHCILYIWKKSKANVYGKDMFIQLFYMLYLNRKEKNAK